MSDEVNLIEELNWKLNESLLAHLKLGELKIGVIVVDNPPDLTSRISFLCEIKHWKTARRKMTEQLFVRTSTSAC